MWKLQLIRGKRAGRDVFTNAPRRLKPEINWKGTDFVLVSTMLAVAAVFHVQHQIASNLVCGITFINSDGSCRILNALTGIRRPTHPIPMFPVTIPDLYQTTSHCQNQSQTVWRIKGFTPWQPRRGTAKGKKPSTTLTCCNLYFCLRCLTMSSKNLVFFIITNVWNHRNILHTSFSSVQQSHCILIPALLIYGIWRLINGGKLMAENLLPEDPTRFGHSPRTILWFYCKDENNFFCTVKV